MSQSKENQPVFIGGLFKSGTSLLRSMLSQHSQFASGLETYWFDMDWERPEGLDKASLSEVDILEARRTGSLESRIDQLFQYFEIEDEGVKAELQEGCSSGEEFLSRFMALVCEKQGKPRWAEKTPGNILHMERIMAHWPDAKIIHIRRNPLDVYASYKQAGKGFTAPMFAKQWRHFMGKVEESRANGTVDDNNYLEVAYEDLVNDPESVMRKVMGFVGVEYEAQAAGFEGDDREYKLVQAVSNKESTTLKRLAEPLNRGRIDIWPDILDEDEAALIGQEAGA